MTGIDLPAVFQFDQGQLIRQIAVNLVRRHEDEYVLWREATRCLQEHEGSFRIYTKVGKWVLGRPVMRWLGGCMDGQGDVLAQFLVEPEKFCLVPDVDIEVAVSTHILLETLSDPERRGVFSEK